MYDEEEKRGLKIYMKINIISVCLYIYSYNIMSIF